MMIINEIKADLSARGVMVHPDMTAPVAQVGDLVVMARSYRLAGSSRVARSIAGSYQNFAFYKVESGFIRCAVW
jgi:hypothetical protein